MNQPASPAEHSAPWTRLWKAGVLHSCASGIAGNYDREILDFWLRHISTLSDGDVLVDVGTGNGAIPLLARANARERGLSLRIHGVDVADIDPVADVADGAQRYEGIRFHPRTSMTWLPFDDGSVSLLCSQFAFEYAPRTESADEILRVIGNDGVAAMIVHSTDSVIATVAEAQRRGCRWLLSESDLLASAGRLLGAMAGATSRDARAALARDPSAESARHAFNDAASRLMAQIEANPSAELLQQTAQRISRLLAHAFASRDEAAAAVSGLRSWIEDEEQRLQLMQAAALDRQALEDTAGLLGASGLAVRTGRLLYGGDTCMGWTIVVGNG